MKPNIKTSSFKLSLLCVVLFGVHLAILQHQLLGLFEGDSQVENLPLVYYILPYIWVCLAGLFYFRSTNMRQAVSNQILAFILTPIVLSPALAVIYYIVIMAPVYGLASKLIQ